MRYGTDVGDLGDEARSKADTYRDEASGAEASASVKPVVVTQLVDLDALLVGRGMRHRLCHHQGLGFPLGSDAIVGEEIGGEIQMLLER